MGVQLEERRVTRISDVVDFPEELDSKENCEVNRGHTLDFSPNAVLFQSSKRRDLNLLVSSDKMPQVSNTLYKVHLVIFCLSRTGLTHLHMGNVADLP